VLSDTMLKQTQFAEVKKQKVKSELKLFGKVTANSSKMVQVFPVVGGNVTEVNVELGDYVEKGKILAKIRSGEIAEFDRERKDAQNDVSLADKNLQIAKDLFESKLNSERDVIAAKKELEKAQSELKRINEVFSIYGLSSESEYYVKAPISGFVIDKDISHDMQLRPDRSENIFTIAEIDDIWIIANVNETDIGQIKLGYEAQVHTLSYPDRIFTGKVDRIFNVLDPETKTMNVRISLDNKDLALKPEMNASVVVLYQEKDEKLAIPSSSIIFDKSRNFVMIFKSRSEIETRPIKVFKQLGDTTYIESGLNLGEKIISKNQLLIYDALND
jgi:cobalt-zinc-cadmium efflux system membrane fusion protein